MHPREERATYVSGIGRKTQVSKYGYVRKHGRVRACACVYVCVCVWKGEGGGEGKRVRVRVYVGVRVYV